MSKKSKISADDFLRLIEDENEHITRDVNNQMKMSPISNPSTLLETKQVANDLQTGSKEVAETDNKLETKWQQTDNKEIAKVATKWQQTDNNEVSKEPLKKESGNKPSTQPATEVATKWQQTDNKPATKARFSSLVGLQREIILLIYNQCKISRSKETSPLTLSFVISIVKTTENSAKVTIQRLEKKMLLNRVESKNGRGGWARFELSESIYRELLQLETDNKLETKWQQTDSKPSTQPATQPATSLPIVVVVKEENFKTTTNTEEPCFVIPNELMGKVSRRQLSEFVISGKISEYDLQLSLDAFAFDLKNKLVSMKHSNNPVGILIGSIKNNGSYNSARFADAIKLELKPLIDSQKQITENKAEIKNSHEWAEYQNFKTKSPDQFLKLEETLKNLGLKGELLEEFTFLEYKKVILGVGEPQILNPLRAPSESAGA